MKPSAPMIERMAEAYWNAFREGYIRVGGRPESYPTWAQSNDPQKDETIRCLRHAVEVMIADGLSSVSPVGAGVEIFLRQMFRDPPQPRKLRPTPTDQAFLTQTELGKLDG